VSKLDFSKPGDDRGVLPGDFIPWRWGVTYTVHPEMFLHVKCGQEYRFVASVLRKGAEGESPGYADLYTRAAAIANARAASLRCSDFGAFLNRRILAQGWFTHANSNLQRAFITIGGMYLRRLDAPLEGEPPPSAKDLLAGGTTPDNYALSTEERKKRIYEVYSEADLRDVPGSNGNIFTMSYGEYVPSCSGVDYSGLLVRAEQLARFHFSIGMGRSQSTYSDMPIVRREWFCASNPDIAVVHLYIQAQHSEAFDEAKAAGF
jgi:hypothetical protein